MRDGISRCTPKRLDHKFTHKNNISATCKTFVAQALRKSVPITSVVDSIQEGWSPIYLLQQSSIISLTRSEVSAACKTHTHCSSVLKRVSSITTFVAVSFQSQKLVAVCSKICCNSPAFDHKICCKNHCNLLQNLLWVQNKMVMICTAAPLVHFAGIFSLLSICSLMIRGWFLGACLLAFGMLLLLLLLLLFVMMMMMMMMSTGGAPLLMKEIQSLLLGFDPVVALELKFWISSTRKMWTRKVANTTEKELLLSVLLCSSCCCCSSSSKMHSSPSSRKWSRAKRAHPAGLSSNRFWCCFCPRLHITSHALLSQSTNAIQLILVVHLPLLLSLLLGGNCNSSLESSRNAVGNSCPWPPPKKNTTKAITDLDFAFFSLMFSVQQQCLFTLPFSVERHCDAPRNGSKFGIPYIKVCGGRVCHSLDCMT